MFDPICVFWHRLSSLLIRGTGTFGIVYKGTVRGEKRGVVAIKDIKVKDYTTFEAWKKEVDFMRYQISRSDASRNSPFHIVSVMP